MSHNKTVFAQICRTRDLSCEVYRAARDGGEPYEGEYRVTPEFSEQTLKTKGKRMREDVTVDAITVSRTENQAGGNTVYIGGIIHG